MTKLTEQDGVVRSLMERLGEPTDVACTKYYDTYHKKRVVSRHMDKINRAYENLMDSLADINTTLCHNEEVRHDSLCELSQCLGEMRLLMSQCAVAFGVSSDYAFDLTLESLKSVASTSKGVDALSGETIRPLGFKKPYYGGCIRKVPQ